MNKYLGIPILLALLAACEGNATRQPIVVTATTAPAVGATVDVNAVRTRTAANIFATQTASASSQVSRPVGTQTAPLTSATETAVAAGSSSNASGGAPTSAATGASGSLPTVAATIPSTGAPATAAAATPTVVATIASGVPPPAPTNTAAPSYPPGVYVTRLRISPAQPKRGDLVTFTATFVNSTGTPQTYKWLVQIYDANTNKGFGETAVQLVTVPPGAHDIASASNWKVTGGGPCLSFYAQAQFQDVNRNRHPFTSTGGGVVSYTFQVCPP
jgi:hypothetical protein